MDRSGVIVATAVVASFLACSGGNALTDRRQAKHSLITIDTHDDTTQRLLDRSFDIAQHHSDGSIDVPRMRAGGLSAIFFSIWTPSHTPGPEAVKRALDQIEAVRETVRHNPDSLTLATSASDIRKAYSEGKIAVLLGVEGGHMIDDDLRILRTFASLGVRYMTLTHMANTSWADSSTDTPTHGGLTTFGKDVVKEMNRLGVIVDVAHVSDKTFYDAILSSQAPVFSSHSSCRTLCNAPRNMSDDMLRTLAKHGGVIQINYHVGFLSQEFRDYFEQHPEVQAGLDAKKISKCGADEGCKSVTENQLIHDLMSEGKLPRVDWTRILDHIDHAVSVAGIDHVGLGSDFDGADMPLGMEDVSRLPEIVDGLAKRGYSTSDIRKILGENTLRVMEQVERVSQELTGASR